MAAARRLWQQHGSLVSCSALTPWNSTLHSHPSSTGRPHEEAAWLGSEGADTACDLQPNWPICCSLAATWRRLPGWALRPQMWTGPLPSPLAAWVSKTAMWELAFGGWLAAGCAILPSQSQTSNPNPQPHAAESVKLNFLQPASPCHLSLLAVPGEVHASKDYGLICDLAAHEDVVGMAAPHQVRRVYAMFWGVESNQAVMLLARWCAVPCRSGEGLRDATLRLWLCAFGFAALVSRLWLWGFGFGAWLWLWL